MPGKLEISFNSPQCGWMSVGFSDDENDFHSTTAHAPHDGALADLLTVLSRLADRGEKENEFLLGWNRDPEEFDFRFLRNGEKLTLEIYEFPTEERAPAERRLVFSHVGTVGVIISAFRTTFEQLYADRETDEFEFNWRQPFPLEAYRRFEAAVTDL